jgi:hypothetical protein
VLPSEGTFHVRYTADAKPIPMLDVMVRDAHGWQLFSMPLWRIEQIFRKAALEELTRLSESAGLYDL